MWIGDLDVRDKIINLLEKNIRVNLHDLGFGNGFLNVTPKAQEKMDKLDFIKIKNLYVKGYHQESKNTLIYLFLSLEIIYPIRL